MTVDVKTILADIGIKITSGETNFARFLQELKGKVMGMRVSLTKERQKLDYTRLNIASKEGALQSAEIIVSHLEDYGGLLGLNRVVQVPRGTRNQDTGDLETEIQSTVSPSEESRVFQEECETRKGKICMHRVKGTWCPVRITKKRAAKGKIYCTKHEDWEGSPS